jgi:hypothetical protein
MPFWRIVAAGIADYLGAHEMFALARYLSKSVDALIDRGFSGIGA